MKKILFFSIVIFSFLFVIPSQSFADDKLAEFEENIILQKHIDNVGYRLLNANKINKRMVFTYKGKEEMVKLDPALTKRNIFVYDRIIQFTSEEDEIAAYLALGIGRVAESYDGIFKGYVTSLQMKGAPKKYEYYFDKLAVDYMVKAGYNPLGLITFIHKAFPQKRYDKVSRHNLTSKRLAKIYEYIYVKYPYFIKNNTYITNEVYQNFLLTSVDNRKLLYEKLKTGSKKAVHYE